MSRLLMLLLVCSFSWGFETNELLAEAKRFIGHKYVWGGNDPNTGADCSGFTKYLFKTQGIDLPRTAQQQANASFAIDVSPKELQKGDLLFFNTDKKRGLDISHVAIYEGEGKMIHAANSKAGVIQSLTKEYEDTFVVAKRIVKNTSDFPMIEIPILDGKTIEETNPTPAYTPKTAPTKIVLAVNSLVLQDGRYIRKNQLEELKKIKEKKI